MPKASNNTCHVETSPVGGCAEKDCQDIVCAQISDCCNEGLIVGEWTEECVVQAEEFCPK
jgi:hypothetical protein